MQVTTAQIWERIHSAGIATPEQCRQWAKAVSEAIGPTGIADPAAVIKELVQQEKLSPYQANVLYRGLTHPLQLGKLRVNRSLEAERGPNWYEGEDVEGARWSAFPPKAVWMVALPDEKLAQQVIQDWPPSLQWAQQHCQVQSPHLDRWMNAGATLKHLFAVCESVPGLLLSEMLKQGPLSSTQAYRLLRDIAMGMKLLHHHRLVHGHLSTHAVVWNEIRGFLLLRDPIFPPRSAYHAPTLSVLGGQSERLALAAPELFLPDANPTIQSDLYALGCLWFRCLTGNWPVDPGSDAPAEVWAKLHAQVPVVLPSRLPEVQKRCLLHLLAKDPASRFTGVDPLLRALEQLVLPQGAEESGTQEDNLSELAKSLPATPTKPISEPAPKAPQNKASSQEKPQPIEENPQVTPATSKNSPVPSDHQTAKPAEPKTASDTPPKANPAQSNPTLTKPTHPKPPGPKTGQAPPAQPKPLEPKPSARAFPTSAGATPKATNPTPVTPTPVTPKPAVPAVPVPLATKSNTANTQAASSPSVGSSPNSTNATTASDKRSTDPKPNLPKSSSKQTDTISNEAEAPKQEAKPQPKTEKKPVEVSADASTVTSVPQAIQQPDKVTQTAQVVSSGTKTASNPDSSTKSPASTTSLDKQSSLSGPVSVVPDTKQLSQPVGPKDSQPSKKGKKKKSVAKPFGPRKKAKKPVWFMPLIAICSLLLLSLLLLLLRGNSKGLVTIEPRAEKKSPTPSIATTPSSVPSSNKTGGGGPDPMLEYYNVKSEDSGVPWTPPTIGAPYSTEMLPPGLEALLVLSSECWMQTNASSKELVDWWKSVYPQGPDLSDIPSFNSDGFASLSMAWYPGESTGNYRKTYRLAWKEPKSLETLIPDIAQWQGQEVQLDGRKYQYWTRDQQGQTVALITDDFTSKSDQQVKRIAIGSFELLKPLLESQGKSGPLRRQLDALLQNTDSRADVTFLAAPSFVFVDGKQMFAEHSEKILGLMREVIDDRVQAVLVRTHFEPQLYVEYRMFGNDIQSAARDATELKRKLEAMAEQVESQLTAQPAAAYWRAIANRFPQMLRSVNKYARAGAEDGQVVFNVYLPKEATSNLAIGSWMSLVGGGGGSLPTKVAATPKPANSAMKTVDEMLDAKISLRIEQESLEVVLQAIANELKESHNGGVEALPMAINGNAFQKDGITRNQQVRNFDFKETAVREILTALCRKANPVTTVQKASEKDQKVVWLLLDDPNSPSKKKLDMTTRAWSESNQATLPKEFVE